ncbi:DUF6890 family protein [Vibrio coralliirubri]|uniref:DUF6890 family protein n=1 Tax=Vibrio coralliirubri TaxID=1516159 RepID=UPI003B970322
MIDRAKRIEDNPLEQAFALRRHLLPSEPDDEQSLSRAIWLDKHQYERNERSVMSAISRLFS